MANDKSFLTYNQQMKKLRKDKRIDCNGTPHKISLAVLMLMEIISIFLIQP